MTSLMMDRCDYELGISMRVPVWSSMYGLEVGGVRREGRLLCVVPSKNRGRRAREGASP